MWSCLDVVVSHQSGCSQCVIVLWTILRTWRTLQSASNANSIFFSPLKYTKVKHRHVPLSGPKGFNIAQYTKNIATALLSQMTHNVSFLQSPLPISSSPDIFSRCSLIRWERSEKVKRNLLFHFNTVKHKLLS